MTTEIKEKLINKFARAIKVVDAIGNVLLLLLLAYIIPMVLYTFNVLMHQMPYKMFDILFPIGLGIAISMFVLSEIFKSVKYSIEYENVHLYKNSILSIILSNKGTISNIILYILCLTGWTNITWFVILLILYIVIPSKVSKYFKNKLDKAKEL